ncbi:MAG TPA: LacI family DNA-binding transcriptional regulator [Opitutus sp.]|nr:LacI family DNA-binding transcriptional regulator [Opitutus sp.]
MRTCTLSALARASGFGISTVSYALRDNPKIPPATRASIKALAKNMGYRPHPAVAALMSQVKAGRQLKTQAKIAFIWIEPAAGGRQTPFHRQSVAGARRRAQERGYLLEEFSLFEPGMTSLRLSAILRARGITGIVFSGCEHNTSFHLEMNWEWHCAAIIGNARCSPELHRAGHYHFMGMRRIMTELHARGYRRPVAILESMVNERASRSLEAAFLAFHPAPSRARATLVKLPSGNPSGLGGWLQRQRPDAIIVTKDHMIASIRKLLGPAHADIGFAVISIEESAGGVSGIDPGHESVAANAVDLVIDLMVQNETGLPANPKELLFDGHWIDGGSLHPLVRTRARRN